MEANDRQEFGALLAATLEVYGSGKPSAAATSVWWAALAAYPLGLVRKALAQHVTDPAKGHFPPRPADVIGRIQQQDGRPGDEEAWSMIPRSESDSVVWTTEMAEAYGVACGLLAEGDQVGARMAFKQTYTQLVANARASGKPTRWFASLGHDPLGRAGVVEQAVEMGRLPASQAAALLGRSDDHGGKLLLADLARETGVAGPEIASDRRLTVVQ